MATRKEIENTRQNSKSLAKMAESLGYNASWGQLQYDNGAFVSHLTDFLDDNPGACAAIVEWVLEHGRHADGSELEDEEEETEEEEDEG